MGKGEKCWFPAFYPIPAMFSTHQRKYSAIRTIFNMSSANLFNLDQPENLSFGTELIEGSAYVASLRNITEAVNAFTLSQTNPDFYISAVQVF